MSEPTTYTPTEVVWALQLYTYNVRPLERAKRLWPAEHPAYVGDRVERMTRPTTAIPGVGEMDTHTLTRYVAQALEVYGQEAKRHFEVENDI